MFSSPFNTLAFNGGYALGVDFTISGISSVVGGSFALGARYVIKGTTELRFDMLATPARAHPTFAQSGLEFSGVGDPARLIRCESNAAITAVASIRLLADYAIGGVGDIRTQCVHIRLLTTSCSVMGALCSMRLQFLCE